MSFTNRDLYMLLGAVAVVALAAAVVTPREVKPDQSAQVAPAAPSGPATVLARATGAHVSPNGIYSTATWAPAPKPAPDDPTPY